MITILSSFLINITDFILNHHCKMIDESVINYNLRNEILALEPAQVTKPSKFRIRRLTNENS